MPQSLRRLQPSRAPGRVDTGEHANGRRDGDSDSDDVRRHHDHTLHLLDQVADDLSPQDSKSETYETTYQRKQQRLRQELHQDIRLSCPHGSSHPDFSRALTDTY